MEQPCGGLEASPERRAGQAAERRVPRRRRGREQPTECDEPLRRSARIAAVPKVDGDAAEAADVDDAISSDRVLPKNAPPRKSARLNA